MDAEYSSLITEIYSELTTEFQQIVLDVPLLMSIKESTPLPARTRHEKWPSYFQFETDFTLLWKSLRALQPHLQSIDSFATTTVEPDARAGYLFPALPVELKLQIFEHVSTAHFDNDDSSFEYPDELFRDQYWGRDKVSQTLADLRNLGSTNHEAYCLSLPFVWKHLITHKPFYSLPYHLILPKYAPYIQSLTTAEILSSTYLNAAPSIRKLNSLVFCLFLLCLPRLNCLDIGIDSTPLADRSDFMMRNMASIVHIRGHSLGTLSLRGVSYRVSAGVHSLYRLGGPDKDPINRQFVLDLVINLIRESPNLSSLSLSSFDWSYPESRNIDALGKVITSLVKLKHLRLIDLPLEMIFKTVVWKVRIGILKFGEMRPPWSFKPESMRPAELWDFPRPQSRAGARESECLHPPYLSTRESDLDVLELGTIHAFTPTFSECPVSTLHISKFVPQLVSSQLFIESLLEKHPLRKLIIEDGLYPRNSLDRISTFCKENKIYFGHSMPRETEREERDAFQRLVNILSRRTI